MQYRYFIGLSLPADVSQQLVDIQARLFDKRAVIAPLAPHITLLPPPDVQHIPPDELVARIRQQIYPLRPMTITLENLTMFDKHALVIETESPELHMLRSELMSLVATSTLSSPIRPFRPHVTVCQAPRGKRLPADLPQQYRQAALPLLPHTFTPTELTLYTWQAPRQYDEQPI